MFGGLLRWFWYSGASPTAPGGGVAIRARWSWPRATKRPAGRWSRVATRFRSGGATSPTRGRGGSDPPPPGFTLTGFAFPMSPGGFTLTGFAFPVSGSGARPDPQAWPRTATRSGWKRTAARSRPAFVRVVRWKKEMPTNTLPPTTLTKPVSEDRDYGFDFSPAPEIVAGLTISSATITGGSGLTLGTPTVTADVFDGIPAGKCVTVRISAGTDDTTYALACVATLSNGRKLVIPLRVAVTGDVE